MCGEGGGGGGGQKNHAWILDTDFLCYSNVANHTYRGSMKNSSGGTCNNMGGGGGGQIT